MLCYLKGNRFYRIRLKSFAYAIHATFLGLDFFVGIVEHNATVVKRGILEMHKVYRETYIRESENSAAQQADLQPRQMAFTV